LLRVGFVIAADRPTVRGKCEIRHRGGSRPFVGKVRPRGGFLSTVQVVAGPVAAQAERYLWELQHSLADGSYRPHPVKRVEIP
jgi:hypothetical protein